MDFEADLVEIVKRYFIETGISFNVDGDADYFSARFCEMRIRRIVPVPRTVHFSDELHDSLGRLVQEPDAKSIGKAREAWNTVFYLRCLFEAGASVLPFLSTSISFADPRVSDGLLWDYGMHHFHLSQNPEDLEFVERSYYLLFAIVGDGDVFFVDVRPHHDPEELQWVRQDLLQIVHSNWPEITESRVLHGVAGSNLTDFQVKELRRKHLHVVPNVGGEALAPIGFGTTLDGHSTLCRYWGDKLLHELELHSDYFRNNTEIVRSGFLSNGIDILGDMDFKLVLLDSLDAAGDLGSRLGQHNCLSKDLSGMGFAVIEATTGVPVAVSLHYRE